MRNGVAVAMRRSAVACNTMRPYGIGPIDSFRYFMPGDPPTNGCWDWTGSTDHHNYGYYECRNGGKRNLFRAHRVSWAIFNDQPIPLPDIKIRHTCDRPICVHPAHLIPGTQADNMRDMAQRGRGRNNPPKGENSPNSKLTDDDVREIRASELSGRAMALKHGVHPATISRIRLRQSWSWL